MIESIHKILLGIHIPFGFLSLVLFWIPVGVKKGSPTHRKVGKWYYWAMWGVVITAVLLCLSNLYQGNYVSAMFLGYLAIITSYPLWYSYEILNQDKEWSDRYFLIRKIATSTMFFAGLLMMYMGIFQFNFENMGIVMFFFGVLALPGIKDALMKKPVAMAKEQRMKMHIQGTIISGIAAYTAFFAFGGSRILMGYFHLDAQWMVIPWIAPTLLGTIYMRYMKKKYRVA